MRAAGTARRIAGKTASKPQKKTAKCIIIKLYSREKLKQCGFMQKQAK